MLRPLWRSRWALFAVLLGVGAAAHAGCGADDPSTFGEGNDGGGTDPDGSSGSSGSSGFGGDGSVDTKYKSVSITPADPTITVDASQSNPTIDFVAKGIREDGTEVVIPGGTFSFDRFDVGSFTGGKLVPTGFVGGKGVVTFKFGPNTATTSATVRLRMTSGTTPPAAVVNAFDTATDPDGALTLLYPYNGTVFPRGLPTPVMQWNGGGAGNVYRIEAKSDTFVYTGYSTVDPPSRFPFPNVPSDVWNKLTDSTVGPVTVSIARYDGAKAYKAKTQTWTIAPANLKGSIYYTRLIGADTFVQRIEPGKNAQSFLDATGVTCIACHSVSKDGSKIVASVNGGASPWAVYDTKTGAKLYQSSQPSGFQAISPNGSHVIWRDWSDGSFNTENKLNLSTSGSDAILATLVPPGGNGAPSRPVWSPDGKKISFAMRTNGNGLDYTASSLWIADVDLAATPPAFSGVKKIWNPNGTYGTVTLPTFSPDSKWLAYQRSNNSRSTVAGEIWIGNIDGTTEIRLDAASGVPDLGLTPNVNWGPSFHPIAAGGYYWMAFISQRAYGNTFNGTNRQIWLAAVDGNPKAGTDPSHPAIYITGQQQDSINERPQFTVNPCKPLGDTCDNGYDCCDGFCRSHDGGPPVCQKKKDNECSQNGEACTVDGDCCNGLKCIGGFCSNPPK